MDVADELLVSAFSPSRSRCCTVCCKAGTSTRSCKACSMAGMERHWRIEKLISVMLNQEKLFNLRCTSFSCWYESCQFCCDRFFCHITWRIQKVVSLWDLSDRSQILTATDWRWDWVGERRAPWHPVPECLTALQLIIEERFALALQSHGLPHWWRSSQSALQEESRVGIRVQESSAFSCSADSSWACGWMVHWWCQQWI